MAEAEHSLIPLTSNRAGFRAQGIAPSLPEASEAATLYSQGLLSAPRIAQRLLGRIAPRNPRLITVFENMENGGTKWTVYDVPDVR